MKSPNEYYEKIYKELYAFYEEIQNKKEKLKKLSEEYNEECRKIDEKAYAECEDISANISRVNAFISIARAHTSTVSNSGTARDFDNGKLSRLAVQIDSSSSEDSYAAELMKEASAQLLGLNLKRNNTEAQKEEKKKSLAEKCIFKQKNNEEKIEDIKKNVKSYLEYDEDVIVFKSMLEADKNIFEQKDPFEGELFDRKKISIGTVECDANFGEEISPMLFSKINEKGSSKKIKIPFSVKTDRGNVITAEYSNKDEEKLLSGIRNFILNIAKYKSSEFDRICFIDPIKLSPSSLGCLEPLSVGKKSFIDPVPTSSERIKEIINSIINTELSEEKHNENKYKKKIYVFHNFPNGYDSESVSKIQQLCANAEHYEAIIILTNNISERNYSNDVIKYIKVHATNIQNNGNGFEIADNIGEASPFNWYTEPDELPESIVYNLITNKPVEEDNSKKNAYIERVDISNPPSYKKGIRKIENIPYGIDEDGKLLTLDFENSNFATFICGAARSGKSTLLHAIITGIIKNNHPDDVEMWLIDFKMTEFSRYIKNMPPHIRYIVLDESPELVYDIIDRLTEILQKRQSVFMGKWEKLNEVPKEKYMPAMFIIIDEFSVMSNIIADSVSSSKDNYVIKMQTLLAKGAALGMHFIFASQGFTSGTRGLNDFAKKQVQQRIAMKTEFAAIRETLDFRNTSEKDASLMEQLDVHHTLTRIPVDEEGNHLQKAYVLYINEKQEKEYIKKVNSSVAAKPKYDVLDIEGYINKQPMVKDGNNYAPFMQTYDRMNEYIRKKNDLSDEAVYYMFVGDPQKMEHIHPIEMYNGFCENVLIISPIKEKTFCSSLLLSATRSLQIQDMKIECMTARKNFLYRQLRQECGFSFDNVSIDAWEICDRIRELKKLIKEKTEDSKIILLLGFENILMDMAYSAEEENKNPGVNVSVNFSTLLNSEFASSALGEGEKDAMTFLNEEFDDEEFDFDEDEEVIEQTEVVIETDKEAQEGIYDTKEDLKYILTHGPRLGYHFMMVFNTIGEFEQAKLSDSLFKHKILFRTSKSDASSVVSSACASVVSELKDHIYRYTDGLEEVSYRGYLHNGLEFDGWTLENGEVVSKKYEEEEYLM